VHEAHDGVPRALRRGLDSSAVFVDVGEFHGSTRCNSSARSEHALMSKPREPASFLDELRHWHSPFQPKYPVVLDALERLR
jgi:hypothetical protein